MGRYPRGMNYTSWSASSYLLQCVFIPLALHMHTSWVALCHPRDMDLVSPKRYVCSPRGMIIPLGLHSAYLLGCNSYLLGNISIPLGLHPCTPRGMQKCAPRGIPKRYEMHSKRLKSITRFFWTYLLERISYLLQVSLPVHVSWVTLHTSWSSFPYLLGNTFHTSWSACHTSWVTCLGSIPLGCSIPLGARTPRGMPCAPRGIYLLGIPLG